MPTPDPIRTPEWANDPKSADGWAEDLDRHQDDAADRRAEAAEEAR